MKKVILIFILMISLPSAFTFAEEAKLPFESSLMADDNDEPVHFGVDTTTFSEAETPSYSAAFIKMLLVLGLMVLLMIITFAAFRKIMKSRVQFINNNKSIKILERRTLSPKSALYLIEVNNEKVLISESHVEVRPIQALEIQTTTLSTLK